MSILLKTKKLLFLSTLCFPEVKPISHPTGGKLVSYPGRAEGGNIGVTFKDVKIIFFQNETTRFFMM
jgi:hypothetical protein